MPTFIIEKLIRDKLPAMYEEMGQAATYRELSRVEHAAALDLKWQEEFAELQRAADEDKPKEAADCSQVIFDQELLGFLDGVDELRRTLGRYMLLNCIDVELVEEVRQQLFAAKGGFMAGTYVETLMLHDDDPWIAYYRAEPDKYRELSS